MGWTPGWWNGSGRDINGEGILMSIRSRWAAVGAAVAVTLGAGGISLGQAAIGSGDKPVFVAITPCRLLDTRPGDNNIGGRTTPLGSNDTLTLQVTGATGECTGIPTGAVAAALNVTAIQGSTRSFLTLYPADAPLRNASNLNWNGGDPPTPNKVDVKLSADGAVNITNAFGTVHVAADLAGYYIDHHHDDRYYTKGQTDSKIGEVAANLGPRGYGRVRSIGVIPSTSYWDMAFVGDHAGFISARTPGGGITCLLPDPALLTPADVMGGFLQDASGNDTRLYFNGSFGCNDDEVRVVQRSNSDGSLTNQSFNVLVP